MNITAFYANWAQFWPGAPLGDNRTNAPLTFAPFNKSLNKIIYGFLLFGVKPNNAFCSDTEQPPYIDSGDFATYSMYPMYNGKSCWTDAGPNAVPDTVCFSQFQQLQKSNPNLKLIASYGGWTFTHKGAAFSALTKGKFNDLVNGTPSKTSAETIAEFVTSSLAFLIGAGFEGVDFDWEYPGIWDSTSPYAVQQANLHFYGFEQLLIAYRQAATKAGFPNFHISIQCSGFLTPSIAERNITKLPGYTETIPMQTDVDYFAWIDRLVTGDAKLDEINIMAYDYYTAGSFDPPQTRPNAPLYGGNQPPSTLQGTESKPNCCKPGVSEYKDGSILSTDVTGTPQKMEIVVGASGKTANDLATFFKIGTNGTPDITYLSSLNPTIFDATTPLVQGNSYTVCADSYKIATGDSMWDISNKYGVTESDLCTFNGFNGLTNCGTIQPGQILAIPNSNWIDSCSAPGPGPGPSSGTLTYYIEQTLKNVSNTTKNIEKYTLGIACYGRSYGGVELGQLAPSDIIDKSMFMQATGAFEKGRYTNEAGVLSYYEIATGDPVQWTIGTNQEFGTDIAYNIGSKAWVSFDGMASTAEKVNLGKKYGLGGVMIFTPQQDDFVDDYPLTSRVIAEVESKAPTECNLSYTVNTGDTVTSICTLLKISPSQLIQCNPQVSNWSILEAGVDILQYFEKPGQFDCRYALVSKPGQTFDILAQYYTADVLKKCNPTLDWSAIYTGGVTFYVAVSSESPVACTNDYYTVKNDTLASVAKALSPQQPDLMTQILQACNPNLDLDILPVGIQLHYADLSNVPKGCDDNYYSFLAKDFPGIAPADYEQQIANHLLVSETILTGCNPQIKDWSKLTDNTTIYYPSFNPGDATFYSGYNDLYGTSVIASSDAGIWISYDSPDSLSNKIAAAQQAGFGGVMSFTPQQDDYSNYYPLCERINQVVKGIAPGCGAYDMTESILQILIETEITFVEGAINENLLGNGIVLGEVLDLLLGEAGGIIGLIWTLYNLVSDAINKAKSTPSRCKTPDSDETIPDSDETISG